MDLDLKGKVAIVTGASQGIGKQAAIHLAREGVKVALVSRSKEKLEAAAADVRSQSGGEARAFATDITSDEAVASMVKDVAAAFGRIDILVQSAIYRGKIPPLDKLTREIIVEDFDVKLFGAMRVAREAVPHMAKNGWGRIVNVGGMGSRSGRSFVANAASISLVTLTKVQAQEYAKFGVTTVCVEPNFTRTERTPAMFERNAKAMGITVAEAEKEMDSRNIIGKLITSEQVADVILFMSSPKSISINSDIIACGGGEAGALYI